MRILLHHRIASRDGQAVHLEELHAALKRQGHETLLVGPPSFEATGFGGSSSLVDGIKKMLPGAVYELLEVAYNVKAWLRLRAAVKAFKPDFIYERFSLFLFAGLWVRRAMGLPLLSEINAPLFEERAKNDGLKLHGLGRWAQRMIWNNVDHCLPVTGVLADMVAGYGVPRERITVIRNGRKVAEGPTGDFDEALITRHMTGGDILNEPYVWTPPPGSPVPPRLEIRDLTVPGKCEGLNLAIRPGEIVGLSGLLGSGRTELALRYRDQGADEMVFYDISASPEGRSVDRGWIERVARLIDIPFCVAGGIRDVDTARAILDQIAARASAPELPAEVRQALTTLAGLRAAVAEKERRIAELERERAERIADQDRLRENLKALPAGSDLHKRTLAKMPEAENRLDGLARDLTTARNEAEAARQTLRERVKALAI